MAENSRGRTIIVGGGAGGLELACRLGRRAKDREIIVVDRTTTHVWKPLLHQVASGSLDSGRDQLNYLHLASRNGFHFELGGLSELDVSGRRMVVGAVYGPDELLLVPQRELRFERLVLALGSEVNDFGVEGVMQHAYFLDSRAQAESLHYAFLARLARAATVKTDQPFEVNIVGGGATGVELAAELVYALEVARGYGVPIEPERVRIRVIERAPRLLPPLPEDIAAAAQRTLQRLGVEVLTSAGVSRVEPSGVTLDDGSQRSSALTIWAAGIRGSSALSEVQGLELNRNGQIEVDQHLEAASSSAIYALGDCAACTATDDGSPVPARAQAARQQAIYLSRKLTARDGAGSPFRYRDQGSLVSLSRYTAFGKLFGLHRELTLAGWVAKLAYKSLYRAHQRALLGTGATVAATIGDRMRHAIGPQVKLH